MLDGLESQMHTKSKMCNVSYGLRNKNKTVDALLTANIRGPRYWVAESEHITYLFLATLELA